MALHTVCPAPIIKSARQKLLAGSDINGLPVPKQLTRSWARSQAAGLLPNGRLPYVEHLTQHELQHTLVRNHDLINHSKPIMEYLFEQVRDTQSMVVLADRRGILVHTMGDPIFVDRADKVSLNPGSSWNETQRGTNAIGLALADSSSVEVHGAEHFLDRNSFLTCAASPIFSARGELLGILDISGHQKIRQSHTLGLVKTAACMVENRLLTATYKKNLRLHLHSLEEGIGSVAESVLALSEDGWILGANRQAQQLLGLSPLDLGSTQLEQLFDCKLEHILQIASRQSDQSFVLPLKNGKNLFAKLYGKISQIKLPPVNPVKTPTKDALDLLNTGDNKWHLAETKARKIAGKSIPLLILGESGVGKELFAKAVHESSSLAKKPFVAINCAALPEHLIESELFGYKAGAFTGAQKEGSMGLIRQAHEGTLFLDEIGDMPLALQARLLRVLQERQVSPLGGGKPVPVTFSLICATHKNLIQACETGSFRSDLYYRINGLTVHLPALRERTDFTELTHQLLQQHASNHILSISSAVMKALQSYAWPGNLRQYNNLLRTCCAMLDPHETEIDWQHLPDDMLELLQPMLNAKNENLALSLLDAHFAFNKDMNSTTLAHLSIQAMQKAIQVANGNLSEAARALGISRQTLYRKLASHTKNPS
jgi:transcriptional regulator of acetoin/glycerol metabolism